MGEKFIGNAALVIVSVILSLLAIEASLWIYAYLKGDRRVVNGGVSGYGTDQAFLRARRLLSRHRFSILIFSFIPGYRTR